MMADSRLPDARLGASGVGRPAGFMLRSISIVSGFGIFSRNSNTALHALMVSVLVTAGVLEYFFGFSQFRKGLTLIVPAAAFFQLLRPVSRYTARAIAKTLVLGALAILPSIIYGLIAGVAPIGAVLSSAKSLIFLFACVVFVLVMLSRTVDADKFWRLAGVIALIQLPACLYQYFIVAPRRGGNFEGDIAWDSVVGTMGGDPSGGGNSPTLGLFCLAVSVAIWVMPTRGSKMLRGAIVMSALSALMLAEVKSIFFAAPLCAVVALMVSGATKYKVIQAAVVLPITAALIFSVYVSQYERVGQNLTILQQIEKQSFEIFEIDLYVESTGEVGRVTAFKIWSQDAFISPWRAFLGYGSGAMAAETGAGGAYSPVGQISRHYTYRIAPSAIVRSLWEQGLLVVAFFLCSLVFLMLKLLIFAKKSVVTQRSVVVFGGCVLGALPVFLIQGNALLDTIQMPVLVAFSIAVAIWLGGSDSRNA